MYFRTFFIMLWLPTDKMVTLFWSDVMIIIKYRCNAWFILKKCVYTKKSGEKVWNLSPSSGQTPICVKSTPIHFPSPTHSHTQHLPLYHRVASLPGSPWTLQAKVYQVNLMLECYFFLSCDLCRFQAISFCKNVKSKKIQTVRGTKWECWEWKSRFKQKVRVREFIYETLQQYK